MENAKNLVGFACSKPKVERRDVIKSFRVCIAVRIKSLLLQHRQGNIRKVLYSDEYLEYYASLDVRVREKYGYVVQMIETKYVISEKFVKKLEGTDFYEARIPWATMNIARCLTMVANRLYPRLCRFLDG